MSVNVIDTIKPKNNGTFPVVEAVDVKVSNTQRLDAALNSKANQSDVTDLQTVVSGKASQSDLNALSSTVAGKQNALTTAQLTACNSGITSALVTQIGTNTTAIAGKASQSDLEATNAEVALKADAYDVTTATANLQAQIDNIVTPVTQDAEVENARVGADGTSYVSLKGRLDAENAVLNQQIEQIDQFAENGYLEITASDIEQGGYSYGTKTEDSTRLRINRLIPVYAGTSIKMKSYDLTCFMGVLASPNSTSYEQSTNIWLDPDGNTLTFNIRYDGYLMAVFASEDRSTDITPSDYDFEIQIESPLYKEIKVLSEAVDDVKEIKQTISEMTGKVEFALEIGGYNGASKVDNDGRLRTVEKYPINKFMVIDYPTDYKIIVLLVTDGVYDNTYTYFQSETNYENEHIFTLPAELVGHDNKIAFMLLPRTETTMTEEDVIEATAGTQVYSDTYNVPGKNVHYYRFGGKGNDWCFVRTPENYDPSRIKPYPFVICNHGNGWSMNGTVNYANWTKRTMYVPLSDPDYINNPTQYNGTDNTALWYSNPTIEALLAAGFVVCGCENYGDALYGNDNCRNACAEFYNHMIREYNVETRCHMIGASNGAQTSINAAYLLGEKVKSMILQYPLTCLIAQYNVYPSHRAGIRAAYGISNESVTEQELISATRTHDVKHTDVIDNTRVGYFPPTKLYYSTTDTVVPYQANSLNLFELLDNSLKVVEKVQVDTDGQVHEHGDYAHFDPQAYVAWFERW